MVPALILLANNNHQIRPAAATRAFLFSLSAGLLVAVLFRLILGEWRKSAVISTAALLLFFSYGHVYEYVRESWEFGRTVARHRYMAPLWLLVMVASLYAIRRFRPDLGALTRVLNLAVIVMAVIPLGRILSHEVRSNLAASSLKEVNASTQSQLLPSQGPLPDIYYIVLDTYSRDDYLLEVFGHDNQSFLNELEDFGFYVARCSRSNYSQTHTSLASSLNMNYVDSLPGEFTPEMEWSPEIFALLKNGEVRKQLEAIGYSVVAFETGFDFTELHDADYYLRPPKEGTLGEILNLQGVNGFEAMLIRSSALRSLTDAAEVTDIFDSLLPDLVGWPIVVRERILFVLNQFESGESQSIQGPKFVFLVT